MLTKDYYVHLYVLRQSYSHLMEGKGSDSQDEVPRPTECETLETESSSLCFNSPPGDSDAR